ncbi:MAG: SUMF1/EgtB/PvdO family nonheme iron enzyme [Chloroflexi bacterium]|nr:SUMF1/EgtB/PvdO family nonheme iron enzyme [Chloroflexota bacterium]
MSNLYLDFELQIERAAAEGQYLVSVVASPAGETQQPHPIPFPFAARDLERLQDKLENALLRSRTRSRRALTPEEEVVRQFGQTLFEAVFQGDVRSLFYESRLKADHVDKGVRLKLRLQPPEFARLPWEFLLEPRKDEYICLSRDTPIVRYLELAQPVTPLMVTPPLRILGMVANPTNLPELDVAAEKQRVEKALAQQRGGAIELVWLEGHTVNDLQRALRRAERDPFHIFHFVGHGSFDQQRDEGVLWLADVQGRAAPLMASQLARLLGDHRPLRLVVLNACEGAQGSDLDVFSSTAATLVRRGIPAVLAMQYEISDKAATLLAEWFYESLADGLPVDAAVAEARKAINLDNDRSLEWGTPVLFMRTGDGRIFDVQPAPSPQPGPRLDPPVMPGGAGPTRTADKTPAPPKIEPTPRPALAVPATGVALPHFVKGAAPLVLNWCWIPGGPFQMGGEQYDREKPIHEVPVDGFWLARYPVTNEQYRQFIKAGGYKEKRWWTDAGWDVRQQQAWAESRYGQDAKWNGAQQPVVGVSWYEAMAFCAWAAEVTGERIRLPTEAEWEKAARDPDGRPFPWGEAEPDEKLCNFYRKVGQTTPVGQYSPLGDSPYGVADMAGNVWDWTAEWFKPYPGNNKPDEAYGETYRVVRGGSWYYDRDLVRSANRHGITPDVRYNNVGFRCASTAF